MKKRQEFPARVKSAAFKRCCTENGVPHCESCGIELKAGNIAFDHVVSDGLGGEPTLENCKVLCIKLCHHKKTFSEDNPIMQAADRQKKSMFGMKARKGRPMDGSRASGLKKKFDGSVVKR